MAAGKTHPFLDSPDLKRLFPTGVAYAIAAIPTPDADLLPKAEMEMAAHIRSEKRRQQFLAGRQAAREALRQLGILEPPPILRGPGGEPVWPVGVAGSISHTDSYAVSAACRSSSWRALGIDIESVISDKKAPIARRICVPQEIEWVNSSFTQKAERLTTIFSAKESLYKAFFQATGHRLGFNDVLLTWDRQASCAKVELLK